MSVMRPPRDFAIDPKTNRPTNGAFRFLQQLAETIPLNRGGTGATTAAAARANLELGGKWNLVATAAPTVNDDSTQGFSLGSGWIDLTADRLYICVDSTAGAAVWRNLIFDNDGTVNVTNLSASGAVSGATLSITGAASVGPFAFTSGVLTSAAPSLRYFETGAPANEGLWDWALNNGVLVLQTRTDAGVFGQNGLLVRRSGLNIDEWEIRTSNTRRLLITDDYIDTRGVNDLRYMHRLRPFQVVVDDNDVLLIDLGENLFGGTLKIDTNNTTIRGEEFYIRAAGSLSLVKRFGNARFNTYGTALTGTTGDDFDVNVGVQSGGRIYIENRLGTPTNFYITIIG